ncbi:MAG: uracil-DNA glycosylase family protein [Candidatus Hadarchaeota archaeon]
MVIGIKVERMDSLKNIAEQVRNCKRCELHKNRTNAVPGEGPKRSDVMLIGEAPGYNEDQQGRPFVGDAGDVLEGLLEKANLSRGDVYIANIIKCRPPENRDPKKGEIKECTAYLKRQIKLIEPKLIVSLGRVSARELLGRSVKVSKEHGALIDLDYSGWYCKAFISYHPAAALYGADTEIKLERDFKKLGEIVKNLDSFNTSRQTTL